MEVCVMRILVATDASPCAEVALDLVDGTTWPTPSTIHLMQAIATGPYVFGGPWPPIAPTDTAEIEAAMSHRASAGLDDVAARLASPGLVITTSVRAGRPAGVIHDEAGRQRAELIVVGSRGHGALESMLLGSVSSEVVDHADVPVLVARGPSVERIVFGYDGSAGSEAAARFIIDSGAFANAAVEVVSVADATAVRWVDMGWAPTDPHGSPYVQAAEPSRLQHEELADSMAALFRERGVRAHGERRDGDPAEQIVRAADTHQADLVVMGTRGRTGLKRLLLGSVARNVLHHAHCSVLIVHAPHASELAA
jgi:nucleotide-binding universal stress UspA family protein